MSQKKGNRVLGMLGEYKTLREERLSLAQVADVIDRMFLLAFVRILAYSAMKSNIIVSLGGYFIGLCLASQYKSAQTGMYKIGQYIKVFLEGEENGLRWHLYQAEADKKKKDRLRTIFEYLRGAIYSTSIAMLILAFLSVHSVHEKVFCNESRDYLLAMIAHLLIIGTFANRRSYRESRKEWEDKWKEVKCEMTSMSIKKTEDVQRNVGAKRA